MIPDLGPFFDWLDRAEPWASLALGFLIGLGLGLML